MTENGDTAQPISLTSQAAAEREASPLRPDEQDQDSTAATADDIVDKLVPAIENEDVAVCTFHLSQLHLRQRGVSPQSPDQQDHIDGVATAEDIVDKLVTAVAEEDVAACAFCLRQLRLRDQEKLVNRPHSSTGKTALMSVATKESTLRREVIVRMLAHHGAMLPPVHDKAQWLANVRGWAIKVIEEPRRNASEREPGTRTLPNRNHDSAREWCAKHLHPPDRPEEVEELGGRTPKGSDDLLNDGRSPSLPAEDAVLRYQQLHPAPVAELLLSTAGVDPDAESGAGLPSRAAKAPRLHQPDGQSSPAVEVIDLTQERSPSPMIKDEEAEAFSPVGERASPNGRKRPRSRSSPADHARETPMPEPRAHLHVAHLPGGFTSADLAEVFAGVPGVCDVGVHQSEAAGGAPFGLISLVSLVAAQHAFAIKNHTLPRPTAGRCIELKLYSADGVPLDPHRPVEPVVDGMEADAPEMAPPPEPAFRRYGFPSPGAMPRRVPRPETPFRFTAAELARRVYVGCLRYGISSAEVVDLFNNRAKVVARVLRIIHAQDGSHSFGFVQLPDSVTAAHAQRILHGTPYDDHLLQVEPVNELNHRWRWSMTLHGLPPQWGYRDGLVVRQPEPYGANSCQSAPSIRVELRYETELISAWKKLDGRIAGARPIAAVIQQPRARARAERDILRKQQQEADRNRTSAPPMPDVQASAAPGPSNGDAYTPHNPGLFSSAGNPLAQRPPPPPPPPPPVPGPVPTATVADGLIGDTLHPSAPQWLP
ncbi:hypothetical protein JCM8202_000531 [Rhodotorula sphaerocarpa]